MISFTRKESEVDIVQAIGRAGETEIKKKFGYVLVPLFVKKIKMRHSKKH